MTRDEYIYKYATQITERQIRVAQKLQANEAKRMWIEMLAAVRDLCIRRTSALLGGKAGVL